MNSFTLKMIAIITMLADHIGAVLVPIDSQWYLIIRCIGRLAFPVFCFLLVEGLMHTRNVYHYLLRLGIFALLSEIPFDLAFRNVMFDSGHQNVFFTLFLGLAAVNGMRQLEEKNPLYAWTGKTLIALAACYAAELLKTDYSSMGIILIVFFYLFREKKGLLTAFVVFVTVGLGSSNIEGIASLSMIFIWFYNGERGPKVKYVFYLFYPVHLLVLSLIRYMT